MRKLLILLVTVGFAAMLQAENLSLKIEGMTCPAGCVSKVDDALAKVKGVTSKKVELGKAEVKYDAGKAKKADIVAAIEKAGYTVAK